MILSTKKPENRMLRINGLKVVRKGLENKMTNKLDTLYTPSIKLAVTEVSTLKR